MKRENKSASGRGEGGKGPGKERKAKVALRAAARKGRDDRFSKWTNPQNNFNLLLHETFGGGFSPTAVLRKGPVGATGLTCSLGSRRLTLRHF